MMTGAATASERPISCILDQNLKMFRVTKAKGKALMSGGLGVTIREEEAEAINENESNATIEEETQVMTSSSIDIAPDEASSQPESTNTKEQTINAVVADPANSAPTSTPVKTSTYLFIEEVLFLHERGLLQATMIDDKDSSGTVILDTSQLHQLLPAMGGMSLAMYLIFSHLRSQDYRVLRHDPQRYDILQKQNTTADSNNSSKKSESNGLRRQFRESIQHAATPTIDNNSSSSTDSGKNTSIAWDVYQPNCQFAKTRPGLPDFYVAATYYAVPLVKFSPLRHLLKECRGIPLKLATISDSGTVVMFGVTDRGVPANNNHGNNRESEDQ